MVKVFFSYSHKDEEMRDELEVHLTMLKRQGLIESWHDRRISAGDEFAGVIDENLDKSNIILLLVSPYFLASDYCYDVELQRAMEKHAEGTARVIPVILDPCDWQNASVGHLLAIPQDGKPISKYPNKHDAFLEIVTAIREIAQEAGIKQGQPEILPSPSLQLDGSQGAILPRSSNLRVKKSFTDQDRDEFLEDTFEYIAKFMEGTLLELEKRNNELTTKFRIIDANHFTASIYKNGQSVSSCKIWLGGVFGKGIAYSSDITSGDNSMNDSLGVEDDGNTLYLKPMMSYSSMGKETQLSQEGAAEHFWEELIQPLQW